MLLGPDASVFCPSCGAKARYQTSLSGNTFGATYWTDGKRVAPMLAELPQFVRCGSCAACYWLRDEIGDEDDLIADEVTDVERLPYLEEATEADMYEALRIGEVTGRELQRQLRILAWWKSNDSLRRQHQLPQAQPAALTDVRRGNLQALLPLLNESDDNDMIMRAEIHRQLGDFDAAQRQLVELSDTRFAAVIGQLRELCEAGDTQIRQLRIG